MSRIPALTESGFEREVIASEVPVIVDYWAPWCGPCRALEPVVEAITDEYGDRVKVAKVNVDAEPGLAARAGVLSIPHLVLYRDGVAVAKSGGARPKHAIVEALSLDEHAIAG